MALRIIVSYRGKESVREFETDRLLIGRPDGTHAPGLDLSADPCVSRQHALAQVKEGVCWLSDAGSKFGTQVNGQEIRAQGERRLSPEDTVQVGETTLRFMVPTPKPQSFGESKPPLAGSGGGPAVKVSTPIAEVPPPVPPAPAVSPISPVLSAQKAQAPGALASAPAQVSASNELSFNIPPPAAPAQNAESDVRVLQMIDTTRRVAIGPDGAGPASDRRFNMLQGLALELGGQATQDQLLQAVMDRVVEALPAARRGALVLRDPQKNAFLLKAYVSADQPAVSQTLVRRAIDEKRGFIWRSGDVIDPSLSMREFRIVTGLYAPVQWRDKVFGVICVDSPSPSDSFSEDDLRFLIAVGQYAGMALAEQQYGAELRRNGKLLDRMMANFSPKLRAVLLEQARQGKLRPGGVKSEVTVLFFDLVGFTQRAAQMDAHDVVEMLNHYFQRLLETIFLYDGTVDKFVGDGVLAVFGSPEPDPQQHQKAIRAAISLQEAMRVTVQQRVARDEIACQVRIGLHCGEVFHGFVGALDRLEFTVIGDVVNRASRYCAAAGEGEIVISRDLFQHIFNLVRADKITIPTKEGELSAYRINGLK